MDRDSEEMKCIDVERFDFILKGITRRIKSRNPLTLSELKKCSTYLDVWRAEGMKGRTRAVIMWMAKRGYSTARIKQLLHVSRYEVEKVRAGSNPDPAELTYWSFREKYGISLLEAFSNYLTGLGTLEAEALKLGWTKQAASFTMTKLFGSIGQDLRAIREDRKNALLANAEPQTESVNE